MSNEVERGQVARELLDNYIFRECMNGLDEHYTAAWRAAKTPELREDCWRYAKLLEKFIADIQTIATTGALHEQRKKELEGKRGILQWPTR